MLKMGHKKKPKNIVFFEDEIIKKEQADNILNELKDRVLEHGKTGKQKRKKVDLANAEGIEQKKKKIGHMESEISQSYTTLETSVKCRNDQEQGEVMNQDNVSNKIKKKKRKDVEKRREGDSKNINNYGQEEMEQESIQKKVKLKITKKSKKDIGETVNSELDNNILNNHKKVRENKNTIKTTHEPPECSSESQHKEIDDNTAAKEVAVNIENDTDSTSKPKQEESKRSLKRKKHAKLLEEKKLKIDLKMQQSILNYLSKWKHARSEWKFEKLKQIWLQQNLFEVHKIPEEVWTVAVEYFNGSRGAIRKVILSDALKIIEENDLSEEKNENEDYQIKLARARDILQSLEE